MVELSYFAVFLLLAGCLSAGVVAAVVHTWSLRALSYSLETRLTLVEGTLNREVKARAGQERWKKPAKDVEALEALLKNANAQPAQAVPYWKDPRLKVGGYSGGAL